MTELYRNELATVTTSLPVGSSAITALFIKDGIATSLPGVNYNSANSTASVTLPFSLTTFDQEFDIEFGFTIGAEAVTITEHVIVVTPVITRAKAETISPGKYEQIEPIVRKIIEAYTGQCFGKWMGAYQVYGEDDSELQLPQRLISLSAVSYNGVTENISTYLIKGDRMFLSKNRMGLTTKQAPPEESVEYVISGQSIFYPFRGYGYFNEDTQYEISGAWGYENVPIEVQKAAAILFEDYICNESVYRNRYVQSVQAQDWRMTFSGRTWDGTGNVLADQLLEKYRRSGMSII